MMIGENERGSGERMDEQRAPLSYRDTLAGTAMLAEGSGSMEGGNSSQTGKGVKEEKDEVESDTEDCPMIALTKEEIDTIRRPWLQTLIVKVMGRKVGYAYLLRCIKTLWHPKGKIELVAIDNDYFLVKFESKEDYEFTKYDGPWMVLDHYLILL